MIGITGANGVLGSILKEQLKNLKLEYTAFNGNITDSANVENWIAENTGINYVFHFAARVPIQLVKKQPFQSVNINVGGCINLLKALEKFKIKPWIFYSSTSHVYDASELKIYENSIIKPLNIYGESKLMGEKVFLAYAEETELEVCIGRVFSFYHHKQKGSFLYPTIMERLNNEDLSLPFHLKGANDVRDISNAEDVVAKILNLMHRKATGIFNIGSGKGVKIKDFVQSLTTMPLNFVLDSSPSVALVADITKYLQKIN